MGLIISGLARFLGGAFGSIVAWIASALGSEALMKFITFGAKISFAIAIASACVAYVTPLAASLDIGGLPAHALWFADQIQFAYVFTVVMSAFVFRWAVDWLRDML